MEPNHSDFSGGLHLWSRAGSLLLPFQVKQCSWMLSGYSTLQTIFGGITMENICGASQLCNWKTFQRLDHRCAPKKNISSFGRRTVMAWKYLYSKRIFGMFQACTWELWLQCPWLEYWQSTSTGSQSSMSLVGRKKSWMDKLVQEYLFCKDRHNHCYHHHQHPGYHHHHHHHHHRPRPAFGRLGLDGSSGGYSSHG